MRARADGVAVISAILKAADIKHVVKEFHARISTAASPAP
jgi:thiamine monophosphate synthase